MPSLTRCLSVLTLLAVIGNSAMSRPAGGVCQVRERVVVVKDHFDPPVKIKAVRVKDKEVKSGEKFLGDEDWLDDFTVSIANDTDKTIQSIGLMLFFLRPEEREKEARFADELEYGVDPFWLDPTVEYVPDRPPIPPASQVDIRYTAAQLVSTKSILSQLGYPASHRGVEVHIRSISFTDGTGWHTGTYMRRDPDPSNWKLFKGWRIIEKPLGSARNGAAKSFVLKPAGYEPGEPKQTLPSIWPGLATAEPGQIECGEKRAPFNQVCEGTGGCTHQVEEIDTLAPTRNWTVKADWVRCKATHNKVTVDCGAEVLHPVDTLSYADPDAYTHAHADAPTAQRRRR